MWPEAFKISCSIFVILLILDVREGFVRRCILTGEEKKIFFVGFMFWFSLFQLVLTLLEVFCHN